jgi:hypothetical protein
MRILQVVHMYDFFLANTRLHKEALKGSLGLSSIQKCIVAFHILVYITRADAVN